MKKAKVTMKKAKSVKKRPSRKKYDPHDHTQETLRAAFARGDYRKFGYGGPEDPCIVTRLDNGTEILLGEFLLNIVDGKTGARCTEAPEGIDAQAWERFEQFNSSFLATAGL